MCVWKQCMGREWRGRGEGDSSRKRHWRTKWTQQCESGREKHVGEELEEGAEGRKEKRAGSQQENHQLIAITQGGAIQLANNGTDGVQGLQTLTMTNAAATQPGTTILQYAQTTDGQQILVPSNQVVVQAASGDVQTYQIRTAPTSTIAPGVVMASSPALPTQPAEEAARKREVRLMKNREAARECRRKKKEYVKCLENRVAVLENQNKTLIEELKALKDLYCHKSD
ncbi:cyclic AMP-responsive element-binding protein 1 isoform X2 [Chelonia mydas]|uniref:cyclic AMP-responsive element-binding protein 1 isoform X2 n=1 Tax=Chelonia mydas TaxID=8469 RepID=UPI001CA89CBE|nr:cyclic AMP-responsive element-binding protein 1 isoform X2 [Chelonia mydas]